MPEIAIPTPLNINSSRFPSNIPSLRHILRQATADDHARLDARLGALELGSRDGYRRFLEINAAALLPLESALVAGGVQAILPDWDRHARSDAILADLAAVGGTPRTLGPPHLESRFALLGTLYVLEGSRLGAAYLIKTVKGSADPLVASSTAYLGHGASLRLWPGFLTVLESHAPDLADPADIIGPARRAFALFETALASR